MDPPATTKVPVSFQGLISQIKGCQSFSYLLRIYSILNSFDAVSLISSNLSKCTEIFIPKKFIFIK
jgi:hypothetical protein